MCSPIIRSGSGGGEQCHSTAQARAILQQESVDLLLLDIEIPTQSGIDFARRLCRTTNPPLIVFITATINMQLRRSSFRSDYLLEKALR